MAEQFRIVVKVDPSGARRGLSQVDRRLERTAGTADRLGRAMRAAFAFAGLGLGIGSVVRTLAGFEQQMSTVRAITGSTETQFAQLREEAKRLGATTRFSASQAAEGATFLARAGFDVEQVLGALEGTLQLAQAGALDLGRAADIASNILTGFRLSVDQTGRVVDVLAKAANSANTDVAQLGDAMKFVAPVAAGLGVALETATAAAAALSDAGLQGSLAGTGLRRVLAELESPAKKTRDILASVGLTADKVRVSQVGLVTALERLRDAGVDTGLALEIFGDRGGPAFEVLSSSLPKVKEMEQTLLDAGGTAERVATIMDDNLNGALLAVASAAEAVVIGLGDAGATSLLRGTFEALAAILRVVADNAGAVILLFEVLAVTIGARLIARSAIGRVVGQVVALELALGASSTRAALLSGGMKALQRLFLHNAIVTYVRQVVALELALGAANVQAALLSATTKSLQRVLAAAAGVAAFTGGIFSLSAALSGLRFVLGGLRTVLVGVVALIASNPVGAMVAGTLAAAAALVTLSDDIVVVEEDMITLREAGVATFQLIGEASVSAMDKVVKATEPATARVGELFKATLDLVSEQIGGIPDSFEQAFRDSLQNLKAFVNLFIGYFVAMFETTLGLMAVFPQAMKTAFTEGVGAALGEVADSMASSVESALTRDYVGGVTGAIVDRALQNRGAGGAGGDAPGADDTTDPDTDPPGLSLGDGGGDRTFDRQALLERELELLDREAQALRLVGDERAVLRGQLRLEEQIRSGLRQSNEELTESQINEMARLTEAEAGVVEQAVMHNLALERQAAILDELRGPQMAFEQGQAALNVLLEEGRITLEEYVRLMRELNVEFLNTEQTVSGGFRSAINGAILDSREFGEALGNVVVGAVNSVSDAIVEFARTGSLNIRQLVSDIVSQLLRLASQQLLLNLLGSLIGGPSGTANSGFSSFLQTAFGSIPGFATGGSFMVDGEGGTDSVPVTFRATPGERVDVLTPQQQRQSRESGSGRTSRTEGDRFKIVNVLDPSIVGDWAQTEEGERVILNVVQRSGIVGG